MHISFTFDAIPKTVCYKVEEIAVLRGGTPVTEEYESLGEYADADYPTRENRPAVRFEDLGELILAKRRKEHLTQEQAAHQSGVSAATISRLERQRKGSPKSTPTPDVKTLTSITNWLGVSIHTGPTVTHTDSTPDIVEAYLRADPKLDAETTAALSRVFRAAYEQFAQQEERQDDRTTSLNQKQVSQ